MLTDARWVRCDLDSYDGARAKSSQAWTRLQAHQTLVLKAGSRLANGNGQAVDIYKNFVRPFHRDSLIFHHTPTTSGREPHGWGALELAARDHSRVIAAVFRLSGPTSNEYVLRPRGLDLGRRYRLTDDNTGQSTTVDGYTLTTQGIPIRLEAALTSALYLFEAVA